MKLGAIIIYFFLKNLLWFIKPVVIGLLVISVIICLEQSIPCDLCAIKFTRKPNLNIQMRSLHDIISNTCVYWQKHFLQPSQLSEHFVASLLITLEVAQLFYQLYFLHDKYFQYYCIGKMTTNFNTSGTHFST